MEPTLQELATEILNEIEKEDFYHAMKHYGGFKVRTTAKKIANWWENV